MKFLSVRSGIEAASVKRGNGIDRSGLRYGRLTVVERAGKAGDGHLLWRCRCDCGTECLVQSNNFRAGAKKGTQSCGCLRTEKSSASRRPWNAGITYQNHADERMKRTTLRWCSSKSASSSRSHAIDTAAYACESHEAKTMQEPE